MKNEITALASLLSMVSFLLLGIQKVVQSGSILFGVLFLFAALLSFFIFVIAEIKIHNEIKNRDA